MAKINLKLFLLFLVFIIFTNPVSANVSIYGDTFASIYAQDSNYGSSGVMNVYTNAVGTPQYETFLILPTTGEISLNLYKTTGTGTTSVFRVYEVDTFSEYGLTYNNKPSAGTLLTTVTIDAAIGWKQINFTTSKITIMLRDGYANSNGMTFATRESAYPPYISGEIDNPSGSITLNKTFYTEPDNIGISYVLEGIDFVNNDYLIGMEYELSLIHI